MVVAQAGPRRLGPLRPGQMLAFGIQSGIGGFEGTSATGNEQGLSQVDQLLGTVPSALALSRRVSTVRDGM